VPELPRNLLATRKGGIDDLLRRALDWLARVAPYDLATVFELRDGTLVVRAARGSLASERVRGHQLELADFPTIREVLETRRARAYTEDDHENGDGNPFDGVLDLPPGRSCMVVPLCAGDSVFGVVTMGRSACEKYSRAVIELVEVYGQLIATAVESAKQNEVLRRLGNQEGGRVRLLEDELGGRRVATLDEIQREHITRVLGLTEGKIYGHDGAARLLGLKPSTLQSRMKKLGIARRVVVAEA
jgi:transcriptional regulator with GAF, ATPase, and Fis domain